VSSGIPSVADIARCVSPDVPLAAIESARDRLVGERKTFFPALPAATCEKIASPKLFEAPAPAFAAGLTGTADATATGVAVPTVLLADDVSFSPPSFVFVAGWQANMLRTTGTHTASATLPRREGYLKGWVFIRLISAFQNGSSLYH
jgi:hypothetical protein